MSAAPAGTGVVSGDIAARLDRLPLTRLQYGLAAITQIYWGLIIATDAMPARLYPFLWEPLGMSTFEFSVILAANIGVGILVGEYLGGFLSDRFGRKKVLVASALVDGLFLWPIAFTTSFGWLLTWNFLFAIGMGLMLATNAVYLHEIAPPGSRNRIALRTQLLTAVCNLVPALLSFLWIPSHTVLFLLVMAGIEVLFLAPLGFFGLSESPRWLEAKGRHEEADRIVSRWEAKIAARTGPLPAPAVGEHPVVQSEKVPAKELFTGTYGRRTYLLLAVWLLGYPGIIYGVLSYMPTYLVDHHWNAHQVFLWGSNGIATVPFVVLAFFAVSFFGERFERKNLVLAAGAVFAAIMLLLLVVDSMAGMAILIVIGQCAVTLWLFNLYNYTSAAYPTRLRSVGTGWTDGVGHLGTVIGPLAIGPLYAITAEHGHWGWILWCALLCGLLPSVLLWRFGVKQRGAILEQVST